MDDLLEDFDDLNVAVNEYAAATLAKRIPHCDCHQSNEAFLGIKIISSPDHTAAYSMVPVEVTSDGFSCVYCGYHTSLQAPLSKEELLAHRAKFVREPKGFVVGRNIETGEEVTFKTAKEAAAAGYGVVSRAIKKGKPLQGWLWTRVS